MSWVPGAEDSVFGVHHLPYGIFSTKDDSTPRIGVRIADHVLDVRQLVTSGNCAQCDTCTALAADTLNPFMALGREVWTAVRGRITEAITDNDIADSMTAFLRPVGDIRMHRPFAPGDYVDFYSSEHHAANVGKLFRPDSDPLLPNWKHLPVGYHGRAGTVVASGTDIVRPSGQRRAGEDGISFGPSLRLDIEAEVGFVVGTPSKFGRPLTPDDFTEHIFGVVLVNDWSARDIQAWEYQPLGPFLAKSFATSVANWVTPLEALAAAKVTAPEQDPVVQPYLKESDRYAYDLRLRVELNGTEVATPPFKDMYWTPAQQLAHLTANGASVRSGDLYASGTVSGAQRDETGSFLELTWGGTEPVAVGNGETRTFLEDGDTVTISATAPGRGGTTIGLGEVTGTIRPAID